MFKPHETRVVAGADPRVPNALALGFLADFTRYDAAIDPRITFSRASNATYFDKDGVLQTASSGVARANAFQDHNPSTLAPLGFLIEEQRTNSIRNNTMQGAVAGTPGTAPTNWSLTSSGSGITRQIVGAGNEDGIEYVDVRYSGTASGATSITISFEQNNQIAAAQNDVWIISFFARLISGSWANTNFAPFINSYTAGGGFDANSTSALNVYSNPTSAALRTQRYTGRGTLSSATTARVNGGLFSNISNGVTIDFTLRIGLPQLEQGAFATSPIKTTTAAAVRLADSASMTGTNFSSWYRQSEGTFVTRSDTLSLAASRGVFAAGDATLAFGAAETIYLAYESSLSGRLVASNLDGGVQQFFLGPVVAQAVNTPATFAVAYKLNDSAATVSGNTPVTDGTCTVPTPTSISIGSLASGWSGAANNLNGHIQRLTYYRTRLPNSTLQALTA